MSLRRLALTALCICDPLEKVQAVQLLWATQKDAMLSPNEQLHQETHQTLPGRPALPRLIPAKHVPTRTPFTPEGLAALLHAVCHIEFNAINLALDAVWRFPHMPEPYYTDWLRVAYEESQHFEMLHTHLQSLGHRYGDFDAHDGMWHMCQKTADDVLARMALVPRTLEARGLDATPLIQAKLRKANTVNALRTADFLDIILREEVGHVAIGNHWYRWLCEQRGLDPVAHYRELTRHYEAPKLRPPFNTEARQRAGFTEAELDYLLGG
ncbi:hypothetical protein B9Z44_13235 [Limnohabitans curvus]|uniref:DUF455 domain-containing protein n=1 Tax=Limnohabitans curvus TaxID=323423 RepID=A0A315G453_9BURK|nr:ferritin-like domain-containing protein [Limnohabitans curvus]PUE60447.1 hypothetical protein B9Z44_13235 [Limnohabitans curvus]